MKFVVIGPTFPYRGGIAHYTTLLVQYLRTRHQVEFYSFKRQYPKWLFPGRTDMDPSQQPLRANCEYLIHPLNPITWFQTAHRIRRERPDAVILQWWVPYWAPAFASVAFLVRMFTSSKILFICHNVVPHETTSFSEVLAKLTLKQGHSYIVHSEKDYANLAKLLPGVYFQKSMLPTYEAFASGQPTQAEARRALNLSGKVILFFGFVREYKGLQYLLRAMPKVLKVVNIHLLVVGEFWERKTRYLSLVKELQIADHVTIVDKYVPDEEIGQYFSATDLVVLPYVDATQSAVVQLAFAFNKPVITTKVGGLTEVVEDGKTGFVVPPRDSEVLADSIIRYFEENYVLPFQVNIAQSKAKFGWGKLVDLIEVMAQNHGQNWGPGPVTGG